MGDDGAIALADALNKVLSLFLSFLSLPHFLTLTLYVSRTPSTDCFSSQNATLTSLVIDENGISLSGLQVLGTALKNNRTLRYLPSPEIDIAKTVNSSKDRI